MSVHDTTPAIEIYSQWVRYTPEGDREEFRLEMRGEGHVLYAVGPQGAERGHGGRISCSEALANCAHWDGVYGPMLEARGFMRVV